MTNKSNLDVAYEIVSAQTQSISFADLWKLVAEKQGFSQDEKEGKIGKFYTNLLLDGRFVNLGDNVWDLRERNTFDKVHIDMSDCYKEDEEDQNDDPEELLEEKEEEGILDSDDSEEESKEYDSNENI